MKGLKEAVIQAMESDPTIACRREEIATHSGRSPEEMHALGLDRRFLKHLEREGLAVRGYTQDKSGRRTRWILVI